MALFVRQNAVTSLDYGPVVGVLSWVLFSTMILAIVARMLTKVSISHKLGLDDLLICCASVRRTFGRTLLLS